VKWLSVDACGHGEAAVTLDSVHARPQWSSGSHTLARHSDTAFVALTPDMDVIRAGLEGMFSCHSSRLHATHGRLGLGFRVGQVRVIFTLPSKSIPLLSPPTARIHDYLAYIEWFTPFPPTPEQSHGLYKLSKALQGGHRVASVVPLANVMRSVHLIPNFGAIAPREWTSDGVLDDCNTFWLNLYLDRYTFAIFK